MCGNLILPVAIDYVYFYMKLNLRNLLYVIHEKYLEQVGKKNHLLFFSSLDHDGHFVDNIVDESVDVEKIVETQMMIEAVRNAISRLNAEERDIIERLYFNDETVRSVAKLKSITHPALIKRRNKILEKLKKIIEEL